MNQTSAPLQRWQESVWLLIAFVTPLFVNLWVEQQFEASKIWLLRTLVSLLGALWLGTVIGRNPHKRLPNNVLLLVLTLVSVITLSTLFSDNRYIATVGSLERAAGAVTQFAYLLLFLIVAPQLTDEMRERLLHVIVWTGVPIGLLGLAQMAGWQPLNVWTDARTGIATTLGRSNFTAAYLAMLVPLTLGRIVHEGHEGGWVGRPFWSGLVGLEIVVIVGTQARAGIVALVVGIAIFGWLHLRRFRLVTVLIGIGTFGVALSLLLQQGIVSGGSIAARWTIWRASLALLWHSPWLGYGADTLELIFPSVYPPELVYYQGRGLVVDRAHNWLLDWSLSYGIVATGLFVALVSVIIWRQRNGQNRWLQACIATVCAYLIGNLFLFSVAATETLFWLLLAVLLSASIESGVSGFGSCCWQNEKIIRKRSTKVTKNTKERKSSLLLRVSWCPSWTNFLLPRVGSFRQQLGLPETSANVLKPENWRYWVVGIAMVVAMGLSWVVNGRPLLGDAASWRGTQLVGRGDLTGAMIAYERATEWQPRRAAYWVALGLVEMEMGAFESAENHLQHAQSLRPTDPLIPTHLATLYTNWAFTADPAKLNAAFAAYEQAIALAPTISLTYRQYADTALRAGAFPTAILQAEKAVDLDATDGIAFGILGWARLQVGNVAGAEIAFLEAVRWEKSADNFLGLATTYYQQNNVPAASIALEQSLRLDPNNESALRLQLQLNHD